MKNKLQLAAILMALFASYVLSQSSQAAADTSPKNKPVPLDQLPPCTNPNVCGAGKDKRPELTLKSVFVDEAEWKFSNAKSVLLDAGHGGSDSGAQRGGVLEKDLTLQFVLMYRKVLEEKGAIVILPRATDLFLGLDERVGTIQRHRPDVAVSVHINSSEGETTSSGIETYYTTAESKPLAEFIHKAVLKSTGAKDRGIHQNNFYIPKNSPVPTILLEHGFINNTDERKLLSSPEYQRKFADGMELGLEDYFKSLEKKTAPAILAPTPTPNRQGLIDGQESTQEKSSGPSYAPFFKVQPDSEWPGCQGF
ncbi:MAG: N-acetylmuramoyl-L-alanine amidase [Candidatus Obscuribacterales bacterium]|nr:N-acetylmuramoyl-L-alanine amidase [Candidatus Obscuribacterales bacterium]